MALTERQQRLTEAADQLLSALATMAHRARIRLTGADPTQAERLLVPGNNPMVHGNAAARNLETLLAIDRGNLERFKAEPFVVRLKVEWLADGAVETLYVTRASAAGLVDLVPEGRLITYTAALGRLAAVPAGESETIRTPAGRRDARIVERLLIHPELAADQWDGLDDQLEFLDWKVALDSLRAMLAELSPAAGLVDVVTVLRRQAAEAETRRAAARRRLIDNISLRDQPILDKYQDEIFRLPLDRQVMLMGRPGTGKTTTLIRRLAQKRTPEALTEDEEQLLERTGLQQMFQAPDGWVMFSPTELLSLYLRDAFNREAVAADKVNLRTWDKERLELARNVLSIVRSADRGIFQLDQTAQAIRDGSSPGISALYDEFAAFVEVTVLDDASNALRKLEESADRPLAASLQGLRRSLGPTPRFSVGSLVRLLDAAPDILQPEIRRLDDEIRVQVDRSANRILTAQQAFLDELAALLPHLETDEGSAAEEQDEDDEGDEPPPPSDARLRAFGILLATLRTTARATALGRPRVGGRAARVLELLGDRRPSASEMAEVGALLVTRAALRAVSRAPWRYVMGVPRLYRTFRREAAAEGRLFQGTASDLVRQNRITPHEVDVVVLSMLRNARVLASGRAGDLPDWLETIVSRYIAQVFVDEATDFSAVQLACMMELTHPRIRSWFACGDLAQRVTAHGLQEVSELAWITRDQSPVEVREVRIGYRQSRHLRELAVALGGDAGEPATPPEGEEDADVWPLLAEHHSGDGLGSWLADCILDVEKALGILPSVAVFVDGEDQVDELVRVTRPWLAPRNIPIVACKDGRDVGDAREVRVFDVRHIKGLEFEAVFFAGIDRLAERLPDLFDRYLYVGITRAATYLGISCVGSLPARLERVRQHFGDAIAHPWR